jgi:hypothetical protein
MRRFLYSILKVEIIRLAVFAIISGIGLGIFIHGYWLIDLFPIESKRLYYSTIVAGILGMVAYFLLFRWMESRLSNLSRLRKAGLVGSSILIGVFLFFTATDRWQQPSRYVTFFLPTYTLQISIPPTQPPESVSLTWFNTSLGEISFNDMDFEGWKRENDQLVLTDPSNNRLYWKGKTGEQVQIVFQSSSQNVEIIVEWDGQEEVLTLSERKYTYLRSFDISHHASWLGVILLGILNFSILSLPLCLVIWVKRFDLLQILDRELDKKPYRFNRRDGILLAVVILFALLLRVPNLENLYPTMDEYSHLNAAKQITQGVPLDPVYNRSLWVVTLPVSLAFRVFGHEVWVAKLPGILFNVMAIVPLYLIAAKINRPVAVLSVLLYATSPWIIASARLVREYAYYSFYYYWIIYAMILFLERLPNGIRIRRDWRDLFEPSRILMGLALSFPLLYAFQIDTSSTFKVILIAYVVFGLFVSLHMELKDKKNLILVLVASGVLLFVAHIWSGRRLDWQDFNPQPLNYFFSNPQQQWYYNRLSIIPGIGLLGVLITGFLFRRSNFVPFFLLTLFAGFMGAFVFSSIPHLGSRHLSAAQFFYVILVAFGLYLFWFLVQIHVPAGNRLIRYSVVLVLGILVMNSRQIILPLVSHDSYMPITEHYHPELGQVQEYLLANAQAEDALITSNVYSSYVAWMGKPDFSAIHLILLKTGEEDVVSIINQYDSGWIVVDKIWLERIAFSPFESFLNLANVEYLGVFGDVHLWGWRAE